MIELGQIYDISNMRITPMYTNTPMVVVSIADHRCPDGLYTADRKARAGSYTKPSVILRALYYIPL